MKNILILVDVQNGFVKNHYAEQTLRKIVDLLEKHLFDAVVATKYWNEKGSIISRFMDWNELCSDKEQELRPEIKEYADYVTEKNVYSSVTDELVEILRNINENSLPEYVFVLGFDTECCVLTTATDLFEMGIRPFVLTKYTGSHDGERFHEAGLISMEHLIGPDFLVADDNISTAQDLDNIIEKIMKNQH